MQDYPHYKYRPRRKKKDKAGGTNQQKGNEVNNLEGGPSKRQPQQPEPAYLQRVAAVAAVTAAVSKESVEDSDSHQQRLIK